MGADSEIHRLSPILVFGSLTVDLPCEASDLRTDILESDRVQRGAPIH